MGLEMALDDLDQRVKRLEQRKMDVTTKKTLIALITLVQQLAEQNHEATKFVLEALPEADALRQKLGDIDQSIVGIRRRLDEVTRQVDRA